MNEEEMIMKQAQAAIEANQAQASSLNFQSVAQNQITEQTEKGLAEEQLDLAEEIETIEHLLRGHIIKRNDNGISYWEEDVESAFQVLNEEGVRSIMRTIRIYLSKRKLLSNYDEETINWKMEDFATRLADQIFMKYREMGFDTSEKRKMYETIHGEIVDAVHDIYLRALGGKERDSIRKHWNIQENMNGTPQGGIKLGQRNFFGR